MESTERMYYEHFIDETGTWGRFWWMLLDPECSDGKVSREGKKRIGSRRQRDKTGKN